MLGKYLRRAAVRRAGPCFSSVPAGIWFSTGFPFDCVYTNWDVEVRQVGSSTWEGTVWTQDPPFYFPLNNLAWA